MSASTLPDIVPVFDQGNYPLCLASTFQRNISYSLIEASRLLSASLFTGFLPILLDMYFIAHTTFI
jgi:hypothetical protein